MKDFKKMPKMADGGTVNKNTIEYWADKRSPESKAAAEKRMTEYKEGKEKSMAQFRENMSNTSKAHDAKMAELMTKKPPTQSSSTKSGGSMGGGASGGGGLKNLTDSDSPLNRKKGGTVRRNKK